MPWGTGETPLQLGEGDRSRTKGNAVVPGQGKGHSVILEYFVVPRSKNVFKKG